MAGRDRKHHGIDVIIHGSSRGADSMAGAFARWAGIPVLEFPADWSRDGKAAGPIRNARMLEDGRPDLVVAFAGGKGTSDMVARARRAGVQVLIAESIAIH